MTDDAQNPRVVEKDIANALGIAGASSEDNVFGNNQRLVRYYLFPTWRSRLLQIAFFFLLSWLAITLSNEFPQYTIIRGQLFVIGKTEFMLNLPWLMLLPGVILANIILYIYNCRYVIDENGVEAQVGLVAMHLHQTRLKYEDIRGVKAVQSLWERLLVIGNVEIGSAMTEGVEITMVGVSDPRAVQVFIENERDKKIRQLMGDGHNVRSPIVKILTRD